MQNRLSSATSWLSSTASRLFSSSTDSVYNKPDEIINNSPNNNNTSVVSEKRGRGRPRKEKDPKAPIGLKPNKKSLVHKLERTRSSTKKRNLNDSLDEVGPNDGEVRYLLTLKSLPKNLEIIAKSLFPPTKNKFEEHRLVCKVLNEERDTKPREIFIPTFRKLPQNRKGQMIHEKEGKQSSKSEKENIGDEECYQRHRPLELAERRERRREDEIMRYECYIRKLSKEYPELLNRKYSFNHHQININSRYKS